MAVKRCRCWIDWAKVDLVAPVEDVLDVHAAPDTLALEDPDAAELRGTAFLRRLFLIWRRSPICKASMFGHGAADLDFCARATGPQTGRVSA